jgi:hypothetical protein
VLTFLNLRLHRFGAANNWCGREANKVGISDLTNAN